MYLPTTAIFTRFFGFTTRSHELLQSVMSAGGTLSPSSRQTVSSSRSCCSMSGIS